MRYQKLYDNHPMAYALAKYLALELMPADSQKDKEINKEKQELVLFSVNLIGHCLSQGHVCVDLEYYANIAALADYDVGFIFPDVAQWSAELQQYQFISTDEATEEQSQQAYLQLVGSRLYLTKYANWEKRLAEQLLLRSGKVSEHAIETKQDNAEISQCDWQQVAVNNSVLSLMSIIVGGPGTGKTTTVAKVVSKLLQVEGSESYRIALAAPTGKAAARMGYVLNEKLNENSSDLAIPDPLKKCILQQAVTLHRLLGWSQSQRRFKYSADYKLSVDCVIVDEASMIDMAMFVALIEALPEDCRLILLGDPFQLSSVQAGSVLKEICAKNALSQFSPDRAQQLALPASYGYSSVSALADNICYLQKSYRFSDQAGIGLLASACLQGDNDKLQHALQQAEIGFFNKQQLGEADKFTELALSHYNKLKQAETVEQAFQTLAEFQLLSATKKGDYSTSYFNQQLQQQIVWTATIQGQPIYHAMPVMMMKNHYNLNLFNGDVGLVWQDQDQLWLFFTTAEGELKRFLPAQIQGWQCAHAITVHKSQGSEYETLASALPDAESPLLTREMFYTAITRAKQHFYCLASQQELSAAIKNKTIRHSGLAQRLG